MFRYDKKCYIIVEHCFSYKHAWNNLLNFDLYFQFQYKGYQERLHWHNILPAKDEVTSHSGLYLCLLYHTNLTERGFEIPKLITGDNL